MHEKRPLLGASSIDEVAREVGLSRSSIYAEIRAGRLEVRKVGRRVLVPDESRRRWLASLPQVSTH